VSRPQRRQPEEAIAGMPGAARLFWLEQLDEAKTWVAG
jgi:hypothetical protein